MVKIYTDEQILEQFKSSDSVESFYVKNDECLKQLVLANYFKSSEFLLQHLSTQNENLNRQMYQQAKAVVMTGIEKVSEKQNELTNFIDKYQATILNSPKKDSGKSM